MELVVYTSTDFIFMQLVRGAICFEIPFRCNDAKGWLDVMVLLTIIEPEKVFVKQE